MEAPSDGKISSSSTWWSSATNWTIFNGSLDSTVNLESSSYSRFNCATVDSSRKSPLILKPPSSDPFPCEIKISFPQKHEIRQVYVRSTARVYEIYYAPALETSDDYLCTVCCSTAAREEELLDTTDIEEGVNAHSKGSNGDLIEEKSSGESNIGTDDDDWVEVNFPDSPTLDKRNSSSTMKTSVNKKNIKDFYEAKAEITDAEPCMSLTLRFLSIQSEGCVYVDEVYVFADPIESKDSEDQPVHTENSAGSSLIAMLVPTLMQLLKSYTWSQNKRASNPIEKRENFEIGSKTSNPTNIVNEIQRKETTQPAELQIPIQVSDGERKRDCGAQNDFPYRQLERFMEQLVTKVSRIEDHLLTFEENMLKQINSIEARLQQVEQQLKVLSQNSKYSGFPSCTASSAPAFSCDYPLCEASELEKNYASIVTISVQPSKDTETNMGKAPAFSNEENGDDQLSKDTQLPTVTPAKSTSEECWTNEPSKYTPSLEVLNDVSVEGKSEAIDKPDQLDEGQCSSPSGGIGCSSAQAKHDSRNNDCVITEETSEREAEDGACTSIGIVKGRCKGDTYTDIPRTSYDSLVDFDLTLEPEFDSSPESSAKSPVALLTEVEVVDANARSVQESDDGPVTSSKSIASAVDGRELIITLTKFHRLLM